MSKLKSEQKILIFSNIFNVKKKYGKLIVYLSGFACQFGAHLINLKKYYIKKESIPKDNQ